MKNKKPFSPEVWNSRYGQNDIPWDIGHASPAIMNFIKNNVAKGEKILIPGAGNSYEAEALLELGYSNVWVCDWAEEAMDSFKRRVPAFPEHHLIIGDFFRIEGSFDWIIEHTFFSSLPLNYRETYAQKCQKLLQKNGHLAGLLFCVSFDREGPPFGGSIPEYRKLFSRGFHIERLEQTEESIKPRLGTECFINLKARDLS